MSENEIKIKKDCKFYKNHRTCSALNEMYCHKEICIFYKPQKEKENKNVSK